MVANETWDASLVGIVSSSIISIQTCEISQNTAPEILRNAGKLIGYNMFLFQVCYFYVLHGLPNHQQIWSTLISTVFVSVHRFKPGFKTILKRCIFTSKLILWPFGSLEWPRYTEFAIVRAACIVKEMHRRICEKVGYRATLVPKVFLLLSAAEDTEVKKRKL